MMTTPILYLFSTVNINQPLYSLKRLHLACGLQFISSLEACIVLKNEFVLLIGEISILIIKKWVG